MGLTQTSSINGGDPSAGDPAKPGTNAIAGDRLFNAGGDPLFNAGGDPSWDDYRLTVRLSSATPHGIGAFVRYTDKDNYYRFSMDAALGYRRLVRKHAGVVTSLWEDAVPYVPGREYVLTLDCSADRLSGYLDGVPLFDVTDSALAAGSIGLYAWLNPGAVFREVLVAPVAWMSHYSFAGEVVASPGTRLRVFSGNASAAPAPTANVGYRFAATLADPGSVRFGGDSADLRLLDATGQVVHSRRFLAPSGYATLAATVLRRADGTGFFVFVPYGGTSALSPGQYRLALTCNRDNRAAVPDSQVLTQNGSADPEVATLDIPWLTVPPHQPG
jgi:hypothetical protein